MLTCINKNSLEYQSLKQKAGIPEFILDSVCREYLDKYDRFPYLDELPDVNSESYLRKDLNIGKYNGAIIQEVLDKTGTSTIEDANIAINRNHLDLEVTLTPLEKEVIVDIEHRPTVDNFNVKPVKVDSNPNNYTIFENALNKLSSLYGINFNTVTDTELNTPKWEGLITNVAGTKAFIYNGEIYINLDHCTVDSPIHEIMHLFIGSMRFTNPSMYSQLIKLAEQFSNYQVLSSKFANRTKNDINEEVFVQEVSKFIAGVPSNINNLSEAIQHEILYNITRLLDTILMGQDSVKTLSLDRLSIMSIKEITQEVNSSIMTNTFKGTLNIEGSEIHRKLNNLKSDLIKQNLLEEYCN